MIKRIIVVLFLFYLSNSSAQTISKEERVGKISFNTTQNIYVRFESTNGIVKDDTLFIRKNGSLKPAVVVQFISSTSCSGISIQNIQLKVNDELLAFVESTDNDKKEITQAQQSQKNEDKIDVVKTETIRLNSYAPKHLQGNISISSYSNFSNANNSTDFQNWRFSFSLTADSLFNSGLSISNYINFSYRADRWGEIKKNLGEAVRIYDLALNYKFTDKTNIVFGRRINSKTSSLGAIDGVQFETSLQKFVFGVLAGSRPSFTDYGYDIKMFEYGGYLFRSDSIGSLNMQNTVGVFQQTNNFKTDRRFLYFQHNNNLSQKLGLFFSSEFDLYRRKRGLEENVFNLTSLFVLGSYTPNSWLSLSASYDARKNVIYYETFKSFADSVLESATREGFSFRINLRPLNYLMVGFNSGYRFSKDDPQPSRNFGINISYLQLPIVLSSVYLNYNKIESGYVNGNYYGVTFNKDIFSGEINIGLGYKKIDYIFPGGANKFLQNIGSVDISWRILQNAYISINYEGTFQEVSTYSRLFVGLNVRF